MISYLQVEGLTKSYGDRLLFADVTFGIFKGDKVALVARNGEGKSTLLKILTGNETPDSGNVVYRNNLKVGFLSQNPDFVKNRSVMWNVCQGAPSDDWAFEDKARQMLGKLGIHNTEQLVSEVSGGMIKRVALARVLLTEPEFLILDEPTNHLDIEMTEWLEGFLTKSKSTLLMVTHDRYFLDRVCNKILEIDGGQCYTYSGNYDYYLEKKQEREDAFDARTAKVKNLLRTELDWMRRQPQARGSKARYRIDNFHQLEQRAAQQRTEHSLSLGQHGSYIGSKIFEARNVTKSFGDKKIISDWSYDFARYDKVGIVGGNGVGKSTFVKMLQGLVAPDNGYFDIGTTVKFGYYSQEGLAFNPDKLVIDAVTDVAEYIRIDDKTTLSASQFLNMFLFSPAEQRKPIVKLSGGERRRLYLATVLMRNPNFLILDEPTNDLDIITLSVLEEYLSKFKGCLIVISHDRFFLDRVAEHLFVFEGDGVISDFPGDYSTYRHCLENRLREDKDTSRTSEKKADTRKQRVRDTNRLTFKERKEMEELNSRLPELEAEKKKLTDEMSSGTMNAESMMTASERIGIVIAEIDAAEMRLLELMEKEE